MPLTRMRTLGDVLLDDRVARPPPAPASTFCRRHALGCGLGVCRGVEAGHRMVPSSNPSAPSSSSGEIGGSSSRRVDAQVLEERVGRAVVERARLGICEQLGDQASGEESAHDRGRRSPRGWRRPGCASPAACRRSRPESRERPAKRRAGACPPTNSATTASRSSRTYSRHPPPTSAARSRVEDQCPHRRSPRRAPRASDARRARRSHGRGQCDETDRLVHDEQDRLDPLGEGDLRHRVRALRGQALVGHVIGHSRLPGSPASHPTRSRLPSAASARRAVPVVRRTVPHAVQLSTEMKRATTIPGSVDAGPTSSRKLSDSAPRSSVTTIAALFADTDQRRVQMVEPDVRDLPWARRPAARARRSRRAVSDQTSSGVLAAVLLLEADGTHMTTVFALQAAGRTTSRPP